MKWLFLFLVVVNIAFFAWQKSLPKTPPPDPVAGALPPGLPRLVLLEEQPPSRADTERTRKSGNDEFGAELLREPPAANTAPEPSADEPLPMAGVAEQHREAPSPVEAGQSSSELKAPPLALLDDTSEWAELLQLAPEKVYTGKAEERFPSEPTPEEPETAGVPLPACFSLGPIASEREARGLKIELAEVGLEVRIRSERVIEPERYWVMVPPSASVEAGRALVVELRAKGIEDLWLVPTGQDRNAISLGLFGARVNAERQQARLERLGFTTEIRERFRAVTQYWLDGRTADGAPDWPELSGGVSPPKLRDCRQIADE
jgi:hypothetical protein